MQIQLQIQELQYSFRLYEIGTQFNHIAGIYTFFIVPPQTANDQIPITLYHLLYLGITNNFQSRLRQHHKINQAISLGMTHIGILKMSSGRKRKTTERKLLQNYNPPLNQTWLFDN